MEHLNYYDEQKYCPKCDDYVRYLQSLTASYCVECGGKVSLFSRKDRKKFLGALKAAKAAKAAKSGPKKRVS